MSICVAFTSAISKRLTDTEELGRVCAGRVRVMVKCVIGAAPSNFGGAQDMLAHKQVLLECSGSTGGDGMPGRNQETERHT